MLTGGLDSCLAGMHRTPEDAERRRAQSSRNLTGRSNSKGLAGAKANQRCGEALEYRQRHESESNRSPSFMISRTRRIA
jgi:hypothetical protein